MITSPIRTEFKARLPQLKHISPDVLKYRAENGISKTLAIATALTVEYEDKKSRLLAKQYIAVVNFSASQCRKELKIRGVK